MCQIRVESVKWLVQHEQKLIKLKTDLCEHIKESINSSNVVAKTITNPKKKNSFLFPYHCRVTRAVAAAVR